MSASAILKDGDKLAIKCTSKPSSDLLAGIRVKKLAGEPLFRVRTWAPV